MAVMQRHQLGLREIGETVSIPHHPVARAMYYLKCICYVLDLSDGNSNLQKLTDFRNYLSLTETEIDALSLFIISVKPDELLGKCLFPSEAICGNSNNKFFELEEMRQNIVIADNILLAGRHRRVNRVMFFKSAWLELYIMTPLVYLGERMKRRAAEITARRLAIAYPTPAYIYVPQPPTQANTSDNSTGCCTILLSVSNWNIKLSAPLFNAPHFFSSIQKSDLTI